MNKFLLYRLD